MIAELPSLSSEQRALVVIDKKALAAVRNLTAARDQRDAERRLFRSARSVDTVTSGLAIADGLGVDIELQADESGGEENAGDGKG
jgi:hypothetical protein